MAKHPGGRPTNYRKDFHPQDFIARSKQGENITEIAAAWECSKQRIYDWSQKHTEFRDAVKIGKELLENWYAKLFKNIAVGKIEKANVTAAIWLSKNTIGWTDKQEVNQNITVKNITEMLESSETRKEIDVTPTTEEMLALPEPEDD